jgi:hypothetical protein
MAWTAAIDQRLTSSIAVEDMGVQASKRMSWFRSQKRRLLIQSPSVLFELKQVVPKRVSEEPRSGSISLPNVSMSKARNKSSCVHATGSAERE